MRRWTPVMALGLFGVTLFLWFEQFDHGVWRPRHTIGVAIIVPAFLLWALARYTLGSSFVARARAHQLVTHGIYAKIRHPIYCFGQIACLGLLIFFGRPFLFLLFLLLIPLQLFRARTEERVLETAFGETYRAYKEHTWF